VFRTVHRDPTKLGESCWVDKCLSDENDDDNGWCRKLGMVPNWAQKHEMRNHCLEYAVNHVKIKYLHGFTARLFTVIINEPYNLSSIISKARIICDTLIAINKNSFYLIALDPDKLLCSTEPTVWSDILELEQTYQLLLHNTGLKFPDQPSQGYFEKHQAVIFDHFENGTFTPALKAAMFAPDSVLHESFLPAVTISNANETNQTPNVPVAATTDSNVTATPIPSN
jgi:hypothetical protein